MEKHQHNFGTLILAAGRSSRLGSPKQLVKIEGKTLIERTICAAKESGLKNIVVVLGANSDLIIPVIDHSSVNICMNPDWPKGMSTSIKAGLERLESMSINLTAVLILLSDQPFVSKALISKLLVTHSHSGKEIIASRYGDIIGVPAIFPKRYFSLLKNLTGDKGARKVIAGHEGQVKTVDFEEGLFDVDTAEDLNKVKKRIYGNKK